MKNRLSAYLCALVTFGLLSLALPSSHADSSPACAAPTKSVKQLGTLNIGSILANLPSTQWAIDQGCFKKYGLEIKTTTLATAQLGMAGLVGGTLDLVMNTPTNLILFMANGDFAGKIVAPRHTYTAEEIARAQKDPLYPGELLLQTALLVKKNSNISTWKDLEKRKIGVKSFKGPDQAGILLAMKAAGVSSAKTEFLAMTDAQMGPALERGDVDGVVPSDPIATQLIVAGAKLIAYPTSYFVEPGVAVAYVSSAEIVAKKTEAMRAFQKAILESNRLLNLPANESSYRKTIAKVTGVSEDAVNKLRLPKMGEKNVSFSEIAYIPSKLKALGFTRSRVNLTPILFH